MGMFDSVTVGCPHCSAILEFQSKAGPCQLNTYPCISVPVEIALDLHKQTEVCDCGARVTLKYKRNKSVKMKVASTFTSVD